MRTLLYRTTIIALAVGIILGTFAATKAWACGQCGFTAKGPWKGNCFITNNGGCKTGQQCEGTYCVANPGHEPEQDNTATLCSFVKECQNGGDPDLPSQCSNPGGGGD